MSRPVWLFALLTALLLWAVIAAIAAVSILVFRWLEPAPADSGSWKSTFLAQYEQARGPVSYEQSQLLLANAVTMCAYLDINDDLPDAFNAGLTLEMSSDMTASVIDSAVHTLCTEHTDLLKGES